jgi:polyhydroxyalkanoate synthase
MMAWNADTTRMPYKMHSEYLHKLYLKNELAQGKFKIRGHALLLKDINTPIIAISTLKDHVAPWESVYKIHDLTNSKVTFILTGGGHNSGIISEPGIHNRSYQILEHELTDAPLTPEAWQEQAPHVDGSWWLAWEKWLADFAINKITPPKLGSNQYQILYDAPGSYVLQQ